MKVNFAELEIFGILGAALGGKWGSLGYFWGASSLTLWQLYPNACHRRLTCLAGLRSSEPEIKVKFSDEIGLGMDFRRPCHDLRVFYHTMNNSS